MVGLYIIKIPIFLVLSYESVGSLPCFSLKKEMYFWLMYKFESITNLSTKQAVEITTIDRDQHAIN